MEKPFEFIESKMAHRKEFDITEGRHPTYALLYLKEGSFRLNIDGLETIGPEDLTSRLQEERYGTNGTGNGDSSGRGERRGISEL